MLDCFQVFLAKQTVVPAAAAAQTPSTGHQQYQEDSRQSHQHPKDISSKPLSPSLKNIMEDLQPSSPVSPVRPRATSPQQQRNQLSLPVSSSLEQGTLDRKRRRRSYKTDLWDARVKELVQFKEEFGHCDVPHDWSNSPARSRTRVTAPSIEMQGWRTPTRCRNLGTRSISGSRRSTTTSPG